MKKSTLIYTLMFLFFMTSLFSENFNFTVNQPGPTDYSFGNVIKNQYVRQSVSIKNVSSQNVTIHSIRFRVNDGTFKFFSNGSLTNIIYIPQGSQLLIPGASYSFTLQAKPTLETNILDDLEILTILLIESIYELV